MSIYSELCSSVLGTYTYEIISSETVNDVLSLWCRDSKLQKYWRKKFEKLDIENKGLWLMKLLHLKGQGVHVDISPFCLVLKKWLAMNICEGWDNLTWPMFKGFQWYTESNVLEDTFRVRPPVIINMNLNSDKIQRLISLCLEAVKEGLRCNDSPIVSRFIHFKDQGVVIRQGYVFEKVKGFLGDPYFRATTIPGSQTELFMNELREVLPLGNTQVGMLLVRVSNFPEIKETMSSHPNVTPFHTDREEYGCHIYATSLIGESGLVWGVKTHVDSPPMPSIIMPDMPGITAYYTGNIVRRPWVHGVPNVNCKRISVTWRPYTRADAHR